MNDMSTFDPNAFMATEITEATADEYKPIPEGVYSAVTAGPSAPENHQRKIEMVETKDGPRPVMSLGCQIDNPGDEDTDGKWVRYQAWLDITDSGALASGENRNIRLGMLRSALGQNTPGQPWRFDMLDGQPMKIKVGRSKDGRYAEIVAVAAPHAELS